jgi:predicted transcriptional regulator
MGPELSMGYPSTTSVKLDAAVRERLQRLAGVRQQSAHWLMREAIHQYLEREEKRERLRAEMLATWQDYQATGQHVSADVADAWLARLEAGEDVEPPACRD